MSNFVEQIGKIDHSFSRWEVRDVTPEQRFQDASGDWYSGAEKLIVPPHDIQMLYPGSIVTPEDFLDVIGAQRNREYVEQAQQRLTGTSELVGGFGKWFYESPTTQGFRFTLRVHGGSRNPTALDIQRLANLSVEPHSSDSLQRRIEYQKALATVYEAIMPQAVDHIIQDHSNNGSHGRRNHFYGDDCLASELTMAGTLCEQLRTGVIDPKRDALHIVTAVATAQSILGLKAISRRTGLDMHISVGWLGSQLTPGQEKDLNGVSVKEHANYIINSNGQMVVGDMGDMLKPLPADAIAQGIPYYRERFDLSEVYPVGKLGGCYEYDGNADDASVLVTFFARGGFGVEPDIRDELLRLRNGVSDKMTVSMVSAKRLWTADNGPVLLLSNKSLITNSH